jgi:hypothetical protein
MKSIREKDLEQAFVRAMNKVISGKEAFLIEETENSAARTEDIDTRLAKLQQELMNVVRKSGIESKEYIRVVDKIENLQERRVGLKNAENEKAWRDSKLDVFKAYLAAQGTLLDKFDGDLFRRFVEKVKVQSMVEVMFVLKAGLEIKEIIR